MTLICVVNIVNTRSAYLAVHRAFDSIPWPSSTVTYRKGWADHLLIEKEPPYFGHNIHKVKM